MRILHHVMLVGNVNRTSFSPVVGNEPLPLHHLSGSAQLPVM